jgi:uncharacterized protein YfaS (alpha-2-macroglobulin family)
LNDRAMVVFALALSGRSEPAYHEQLYRRRSELSQQARALVALAIKQSGGAADVIADLLDERAGAPDPYSWFGSPATECAIRLMAWSEFKPRAKAVGRLAKELLEFRRNGHWRTTQENAWALLALARYFALVEGKAEPVSGSLTRDEGDFPFKLTREQLSETVGFAFDPAHPPGPLSVRNPEKKKLYGETRFVVRPSVSDQPRQDRGFSVSRSYRKVGSDGSLEDISHLRVGDRAVVTLRIETQRPSHFVVIDDPLPATFEGVNPEFRTQQVGGEEGGGQSWVADYRETRADRVLYFCDHLPPGAFTFTSLARVRLAGNVTAPGTKVEEMYQPERFGISETARLASIPAER